MEERNGLWIRICPKCSKEVEHKNRSKCRIGEKENKLCSTCNRSAIGKANSSKIICPICSSSIEVSRTAVGLSRIEFHASDHGMTAEQLWMITYDIKQVPECACGCKTKTIWSGWKAGFSCYIRGHNVLNETVEAKKIRISAVKDSYATGKSKSWSKGLTKESDERVKQRGLKTSVGRSKAFAEKKICIWSKGKTKNNDPRLKQISESLIKRFADGVVIPWSKGLSKHNDVRIANMASKVSMTHSSAELRKRLDEMKRYSVDEIKAKIENGGLLTLVNIEGDYINYLQPNIVVCCNRCNTTWNDSVKRLETTRCYKCDPAGSRAQSEICEWIKQFNLEILSNTRSIIPPTELDIYANDKKVAIEYNGLYWHSITHKSSTYHQIKSEKCSTNKITLLHVFEDEWRDKRNIVESMIKHRVGLTTRKINARSCTLKTLDNKTRREFFQHNHLDGDVQAHSAYGLFYKDELVAAISLRIPFHKRYSKHIEIARICTLLDTNVRGAISKLTKFVKNKVLELGKEELMSYVDFRFGSDLKTWENCGWKFISYTAPRWWWTDYHDRFNRFKFRADKFTGRSEEDVASEAGVVKIYGCSNILFTMKC